MIKNITRRNILSALIIILIPLSNYNFLGRYTSLYIFFLTGLLFFSTIQPKEIFKDKGFKILLLFGMYMVLNNIIFLNKYRGINIITRFFSYMIFAYGVILSNVGLQNIAKFLNILIAVGLVDAIFSILQAVWGEIFYVPGIFFPESFYNFLTQSIDYGNPSGLGLFISRAYNAIFLLIIFNILFVYFIIKKNKKIWIGFLIIVIIAINLTYSRVGITLLAINCLVWLFYTFFLKRGYRLSLYIIFSAFLLYFAVNSEATSFIIKNISSRFEAGEIDYRARQLFWAQTMGTLETSIDLFIGRGIGFTGNKDYTVEVHNAYIEIIAEIGIIGLIIWLLFIMRIFDIFVRSIRTMNFLDPISLCFLISAIDIIINCYLGSATGGSIRSGDIIIILPFALLNIVCKKRTNG